MAQEKVWEREYSKPTFLTKENKPQADVVRFVHFLKKQGIKNFENTTILDLGAGTGRNSFYFAEMGAKVIGLEISETAIGMAEKNAKDASLDIKYIKQSIGETFPCDDSSFDIALDVTSSNSLSESEREVYFAEVHRTLKDGGYFFTKALCKDGDDNAKFLIKNNPGPEVDTYVMPDTGIIERVWTKEDFVSTYEKYFHILNLEKKQSYTRMNDRVYKRNFWIAYMQK